MAKQEVYRIEIPIIATDEYTDAIRKAENAIKKLLKQNKKNEIKIETDTKQVKTAEKDVQQFGKTVEQQTRRVSQLQRTMRRKGEMQVSLRDHASRGLQSVQRGWERLSNSRMARLAVSAEDRATRVLRGVGRTISSLPSMITIGIGVVGASKAVGAVKNVLGQAMRSAMDWEVNEVAMMHRLSDDTAAGKHWMNEIGMLADKTPYSSPDLIPAFTQGLTLSKKDPAKAFDYTKIATDMAALTPGKSPEDAMSALLGASMGNYEMLEAYGFKITKDVADGMGGFKGVFDAVVKEYEGGAEKLSATNSGIISTLKGYQGSLRRSFGQGLLKPIGEELNRASKFIDDNQEGWGNIKDTVSAVGLGISTHVVDKLRSTGGYLSEIGSMLMDDITIERDEFGSITNANEVGSQALENLKETKDKVLADMSNWWDETGKPKAVEVGTALGEGAVDALIAGIPFIADALYDLTKGAVSNALKNPSMGSIGGAALALGGAGYVGAKGFRGIRGAYRGVKKVGDYMPKQKSSPVTRRLPTRRSRPRQVSTTERNRLARNEMERARRYSQTPQAYRPPKNAKSMLGFSSGMPGMSGGGRLLKGVGGKIPGLNILFGAMDATSGWKDASNIMGKASDELTFFDKTTSSAAKILEGFSFGLLRADKTADFLTGGKSESRRNQLLGQEESQSPLLNNNFNSMPVLDPGMGVENIFSLDTSTLQTNINNLTMHVGEASGYVVGAFYPLEGSTAITSHNIEALNTHLGEASSWVVESFFPMVSASGAIGQNVEALSINLAEASVYTVESFYPLSESGAVMNQNVMALSTNLGESSIHVVGAFYQLSESGPVLNQNVSALSINVGKASGWVNSLYGIQEGAESVKTALGSLASRIRRVPTPTMPTMPSIPLSLGGVTPYARGGIATSPHLGLVAEAGVPEAMIPWDGSTRSQSLWMRTGEALGMFDSTPARAYDTMPSSDNAGGASPASVTVPLSIVKGESTEDIIEKAKSAIAHEIRKVLETTT